MSRLIVKNLPKHLTEQELQKHFGKEGGVVTDSKIMFKNGRSRLFGFVGFKNEADAQTAQKYFNGTYLHTSKIQVDMAKMQGDDALARPWSKYSEGSSAFKRRDEKGLTKKEHRGSGNKIAT